MQIKLTRFLGLLLTVISFYFYFQVLSQDVTLKQILLYDKLENNLTDKITDGLPYYQPLEKVIVLKFNAQLASQSFETQILDKYANRLLEANSRSSQGFYIRAVSSEVKGNLENAIRDMQSALSYDVYNTTYLRGLVILQINTKDFDSAIDNIAKIRRIDPKFEYLDMLEEALMSQKNLYKEINK